MKEIKIPKQMKDNMKEQRLQKLQQQLFNVEMDIVSAKAIGDSDILEKKLEEKDIITKAYNAIESM